MAIDPIGLSPAWTLAATSGAHLWVTAAKGFILIADIVFGIFFSRYSLEPGA